MKSVYIIVHNIKNLAKKNRMILSLVIVSTVVSTFGILFYSGYILKNYYDTQSKIQQEMEVTFKEEVNKQQVHEVLKKLINKEKRLIKVQVSDYDQNSHASDTTIIMESDKEDENTSVAVMGEYVTTYGKLLEAGRGIKLEEIGPLVLIPEELTNYIEYEVTPINKRFSTGGKEFEVVGVLGYSENDGIIVPVNYYIDHFPVNHLRICYAQALSKENRQALERILIKSQVIEDYQFTKVAFALFSSDFWIEFIQILIIFVVIIINIFVLIYFLMNRMKRSYKIYSICGGSSSRVYKIIVLQTFFLILVGITIGLIVYLCSLSILARYELVYDRMLSLYMELAMGVAAIEFLFSAVVGKIVHSGLGIYQIAE